MNAYAKRALLLIPLFIVFALSMWLSSCKASPQETKQTSNAEIKVELLFEHEGVRMYRFQDGSRYHYYAVPRSGWSSVMYTENCGKNCSREVSIPTVALR